MVMELMAMVLMDVVLVPVKGNGRVVGYMVLLVVLMAKLLTGETQEAIVLVVDVLVTIGLQSWWLSCW